LSEKSADAVENNGAEGALTAEVLFGQTEAMQRIRKLVERIAPVRVPVLIEGESGTGKEAIAAYIHRTSPWSERPFLKVNCAAIPGALLESELFGYEKGSFTGAYASRPGKFEIASDGSILLDEIADMDSSIQAKLLQVLQDGRFFRIGDMDERRADARILCITSRKVEAEIERGNFREDLYYRINVVNVRVPPLRERLQDLNAIVDYFIAHYGQLYDRQVSPLPASMLERFRQHAWPGNIRELENYLKRYVILGTTEGMLSELEQRNQEIAAGGFKLQTPEDFSLKKFSKQAAQHAEKFLMLEALKQTRWNRKRAAVLLGISYRALLYKLSEAGLPRKKQPAPTP